MDLLGYLGVHHAMQDPNLVVAHLGVMNLGASSILALAMLQICRVQAWLSQDRICIIPIVLAKADLH